MITFLLISCILQWLIIIYVYVTRHATRWITFEWITTFFGKVRCGFQCILWKQTGPHWRSGKSFIKFVWRDPQTVEDKPYIKPKSKWAKPSFRKA